MVKTLADKIKTGDVVIQSSEYTRPPDPWWTNRTDLWLVRGEEQIFCSHVAVTAVEFRAPVLAWQCSCHAKMEPDALYCTECSDPRSHARSTMADGEFTVRSVLPFNGFLWDLMEGDQLVIRHTECGRRDVWENGELVAALTVDVHGYDCSLMDLVLPEKDDFVRVGFTATGTVEAFRKWQT